ncbi:hypothetical protein E2C01_085184 [Portunus trituberculatus]|uniref:Uncharacterized protein n=1 Tax=Portunus trituberculatus TaxID=210409 RepID=A0A5B7J0A3_PORTR|nr:hypothetical protein [Portunus trituberculatus]
MYRRRVSKATPPTHFLSTTSFRRRSAIDTREAEDLMAKSSVKRDTPRLGALVAK